jgi:asparagine synthase (glutamine-hydrolysing)
MCGICGCFGPITSTELGAMTQCMAHRGPDGQGLKIFSGDPPVGLGHRRLAILDPTPAGAQPMAYRHRWWITYNGELYNFRQLRRELQAAGERFHTECDTEVLLRMFSVHGPRMLERLNGIYAFAIWDNETKRLFLARDRLGVKPLYYVQTADRFAFASELKALLPLIGNPSLDETALIDYLTFLWVPDPRTTFREVKKLPPGHLAWIDKDGVSIERFWDLRMAPEEHSEEEWLERVAETVSRSVKRQMVSDVPLGSFLSGGVDSSAIVAAMARTGNPVTTYSIGFSAEDLRHEIVPDDLHHARRVAALYGTDHHERTLESNMLELLPKAVWHLEEPVGDPAAISTYLICREARRSMPVMLSGMGADEIFAGYPRYLAFAASRALGRIPAPLLRPIEKLVSSVARPGAPGRLHGPRRNLWKFMRGAGQPLYEHYLAYSTYYTAAERCELLQPDVRHSVGGYDPLSLHRAYLDEGHNIDELGRILRLDIKTFLPCLNLAYTDKMGMAASVEVRVPLLDDELVALSAQIPSRYKLKGWRRKYIFKRSQERVLPNDIVWRRKAGFGAPIRSWLVGNLDPMVEDILSEETLRRRGLVRPEVVSRMRAANSRGLADMSVQLYALLSLELWHRTFLDRTWRFETQVATPTCEIIR